LAQIKVTKLITTLVQIANYTSPNNTDHPHVNIHCIENFFTVHHFWATCACPEKSEFALKMFTELNIIFTFRIFEQLVLALKNRVCLERFPCIANTFCHSGFLSNLHLPWKQNCPWIFHCIEIFFIIQDFLATCACTENRDCPENVQARVGGRPPPDTPPLMPTSGEFHNCTKSTFANKQSQPTKTNKSHKYHDEVWKLYLAFCSSNEKLSIP